MSNIIFDITVVQDLKDWSKNEPKLVKKFFDLLADIHKTPFEGLGKPEALKHQYKGLWSRRITDEHRLIYQVLSNGDISIISVHGHYEM
ncbi:MAG TPA: Txe/YoeB family addiction module toxin [Parafilimonas sp.]|nr:Txe/YoeB family addiction module toxin [Parafilimonas sp.]